MTADTPPLPTDGELALLRVLWARGPSTVREIHEASGPGATGYTTALKLLQIMHEKGLVARDETSRAHVYRATEPEETTQSRLVGNLVGRAFGGSATRLVQRALSDQRASSEDRDEIRRLLDELDGRDS